MAFIVRRVEYFYANVHDDLGAAYRVLSELAARGAPYIPSYFAFVREFVVGSLRRSPLGRWLARG